MTRDKASAKVPTRERVLDAAERLLAGGSAGFSMRELAEAAGVSFATPFNQFGSKGAIILALSARRIAAMHGRFAAATRPETAPARVRLAVEIAATVMLEAPAVNRAVMGALGASSEEAGDVSGRSRALWAEALGDGNGLAAVTRPLALTVLPAQLAFAFRGVLSFWTVGEVPDARLSPYALAATAAALLGFADSGNRTELLALLDADARLASGPT